MDINSDFGENNLSFNEMIASREGEPTIEELVTFSEDELSSNFQVKNDNQVFPKE